MATLTQQLFIRSSKWRCSSRNELFRSKNTFSLHFGTNKRLNMLNALFYTMANSIYSSRLLPLWFNAGLNCGTHYFVPILLTWIMIMVIKLKSHHVCYCFFLDRMKSQRWTIINFDVIFCVWWANVLKQVWKALLVASLIFVDFHVKR